MGGTSTDVAIFPGEMIYTREAAIAGMPLRLPIIDVHTVGAGGGSIARVDAGGALRVGPESAGAAPGPACYGEGNHPTTSDANALLGRLHPDFFLGGQMTLHLDRAQSVLSTLATELGVVSAEEAAWGVLQVANAAMDRAIRAISVERGYDPRDFTLVPFGGAGPLHACALAETLRIPRILIPRVPGVLSALGMTIADRVKDVSQAVFGSAEVLEAEQLSSIFAPLVERIQREMIREGVAADHITLERALDMRYRGQSHAVTVGEPPGGNWLEEFHAAHARRYGHRHDEELVEIITARVRAVGPTPQPKFERLSAGGSDPTAALIAMEPVWFSAQVPLPTPLYRRADLLWENEIEGPAVVFQMDTTTVINPGWKAVVDEWGNLVLNS
jgi:N-methylhydantoinase A